MSKALIKSAIRSIRFSKSRFISIIIIVALGISFFAGFKATSPNMKLTANKYFLDNNLMDLRIQSTVGLTSGDLKALSEIEGVEYVAYSRFVDALVYVNGKVESDIDGSQISARAYGLDFQKFYDFINGAEDGSFINRPTLLEGEYPTQRNECLVDASKLSTPESYKIGSKITLENTDESVFATVDTNEFTIVGIIETPYYLSFERGNTLVGSGKVGTFIYVSDDIFTTDYYTEIYLTVEGARDFDTYSDEYYEHLAPVAARIEELAPSRLEARTTQINVTLPTQISNGRVELAQKQAEKDEKLKDSQEKLATLKMLAEDGDNILQQKTDEFNREYAEVKGLLDDASTQTQTAIETYNNLYQQFLVATARVASERQTYDASKAQFDSLSSNFTAAGVALNAQESTVKTLRRTVEDSMAIMESLLIYQEESLSDEKVSSLTASIGAIFPEMVTALESLSAAGFAKTALSMIQPTVANYQTQLAAQEADLAQKRIDYDAAKAKLDTAQANFDAAGAALATAERNLIVQDGNLKTMLQTISQTNTDISQKKLELYIQSQEASMELAKLKDEIALAKENYDEYVEEYLVAEAQANEAVFLAETKIKSAEKLLGKVATAEWHVYNRLDTPGYTSYSDAINTVKMVSNIFPSFFFIVAALISLTTITRMVEEDRTQFGTLMALGYSSRDVIMKYIIYALLAAVIGCGFGLFAGFYFIPKVIMGAYGIMFNLPDVIITYPIKYIIIGVLISLASTVVAALFACRKDINVNPAILMRPKAPKPGKRVFLEKLDFVWSRLNFTSKVTVRNLFRNPKRFFMTLFGMAGCTALLLAAFGFYNSINAIMTKQYGEGGIAQYDVQFVFANSQNPDENPAVMTTIKENKNMESAMLTSMQSMDGGSDREERLYDVYLFVPENKDELNNYINLHNRKSGKIAALSDDSVLITEKFARDTDTQIGDTIFVRDSDGKKVYLTVSDIVENYTFNFVYISRNMYKTAFGEDAKFNYAVGRLTEKVRNEENTAQTGTATSKSRMASDLMKDPQINAIAYTTQTIDEFSEIVKTISILVLMFIGAAVLLALIVLYNLSNINITERSRELATLKVVGFYDKEVYTYIQRENIVLTLLSVVIGIIIGVILHKVLINYTEVDMVMFGQSINWLSFILAPVLSVVFSLLVNFLMRKKMRNVDMVESFKSVE